MTTNSTLRTDIHFLPTAFREFLKRRLNEAWGLSLILGGIYLFIALMTYDPSDPSWNTEINSHVRNWGGTVGSFISDLFHQFLGIGSFLGCFLLLNWGRLKLVQKPIRWIPLKLFLFATSLILWGIVLHNCHLSGGAMGYLLTLNLFKIWPFLNTPLYKTLSLIICLGVALSLLLISFNISFKATGKVLGLVGIFLFHRFKILLFSLLSWCRTLLSPRRSTSVPEEQPQVKLRPRPSLSSLSLHTEKKEPSHKPSKPFFDIETRSDYQLPPLSLLADAKKTGGTLSKSELEETAARLMDVLEEFGIKGEIAEIRTGPVVTLYELVPAAGIKSSRVIGLADDIARSMSAISTRVAVIPGRNAIGIELPNEKRQTVFFKELLTDKSFENNAGSLPLVLGKDIAGHAIIADLARMPHLLVAGTTGSGKSVGINSMILSLIYRLPPDQCKFIMIDPKMLELSIYNDIPHLLTPVVTEPKKAIVALKWAVREMENRYRNMSKLGVRNITGYNERVQQAKAKGETITRRVQTGFDSETGDPLYENQALDLEPLPYIVVVVDEMADLMLVAGKEIEAAVQRLAQMARAAGIHLIMATQRPSVDVITGTIKANFPTRISFQVTSKIDSRTILGEQGAEQLLGMGDLLFLAPGGRTTRVHGPFVSDQEVEKVVQFLKQQSPPHYIDAITEETDETDIYTDNETSDQSKDSFYDQAVSLILRENKVSTSFIQRHFQIGYNRAARIVEQMESDGIISPPNRMGRREILTKQKVS